jgi:large subunit ribosomal protein L15
MNLHDLKDVPGARRRRKRVGRGEASGWGRTSGRGNKGQRARAGSGYQPTFEGGQMPLIRRLPKRGFTHSSKTVYHAINVGALNVFEDGTEVTPSVVARAGLARGRADGIKILGGGDLHRRLVVKAHAFSASARAKIEAAGGRCEAVAKPAA